MVTSHLDYMAMTRTSHHIDKTATASPAPTPITNQGDSQRLLRTLGRLVDSDGDRNDVSEPPFNAGWRKASSSGDDVDNRSSQSEFCLIAF